MEDFAQKNTLCRQYVIVLVSPFTYGLYMAGLSRHVLAVLTSSLQLVKPSLLSRHTNVIFPIAREHMGKQTNMAFSYLNAMGNMRCIINELCEYKLQSFICTPGA